MRRPAISPSPLPDQDTRGFPTTLIRFGQRYLQRHPWQTILMIIGIMLGVAVVVAIDLANASASRAFELSTDMVVGRATHQVVGGPTGLDQSFYVQLRRQGIPVAAAPVVVEYAASPQLGDRSLQLLGIDPLAEAPFRDYFSNDAGAPVGADSRFTDFLTQPGAIFISSGLAERYGLTINDRINLIIAGQEKMAFIAGLLQPADGLSRRALEGTVLADIATAQELTGRSSTLDRVDLILPPQSGSLRTQIERLLPPGSQVVAVEARSATLEQMTAAFRTNLTALSLLALIVGLFLIYNTMTFSVVQRRPLFGTLRALGVTRREVFVLVVGEAALAGVLGTALGLALGVVLGQGAVRLVSQTINDLYFVVTVTGVNVPVASLIKGGVMGVMATILAAAPPAWEAASVPPNLALSRSGLEDKASRAVTRAAIAGFLLAAAGGLILFIPTQDLVISFGGTFAIIIGFAMLTPRMTAGFMRLVSPLSSRLWGAIGRLAPRNVISSLSRTSVAVAALMIAVSVTIGVSVMIGSFRGTVELWLTESVQGDVYLSPPTVAGTQSTGVVDPDVLPKLRQWKGIARVDTFRAVQVETPIGPVTLANTLNPTIGQERVFQWVDFAPELVWDQMLLGAVLISEPLANRLDLERGQAALTLLTPNGQESFPVAGVYYDYSSSQGTVMMAEPVYRGYWQDSSVGAVSLRLEPGVDADQISLDLADALAPIQKLQVRPNRSLRMEALEVFDRTFAITSAMQLLTTVVAFVGVLSALLSLQLDKQRELGVLRAVGLTVRQLWRLVLLESGLMGAAAGLLALPTGFILALILIYIINRRAFGWTLQMQLDPLPFAQAFLVAVAAAILAAIVPTRRLSKRATAEVMRNE